MTNEKYIHAIHMRIELEIVGIDFLTVNFKFCLRAQTAASTIDKSFVPPPCTVEH